MTRDPELWKVTDVAEYLRTTPKAVYRMAERRQLPGVVRLGRRLLFHSVAIRAYVDECSTD